MQSVIWTNILYDNMHRSVESVQSLNALNLTQYRFKSAQFIYDVYLLIDLIVDPK